MFANVRAAIAQLGERQTEDLKVPGSIPGLGTYPMPRAPGGKGDEVQSLATPSLCSVPAECLLDCLLEQLTGILVGMLVGKLAGCLLPISFSAFRFGSGFLFAQLPPITISSL